jgi:multiple sugar transport system ATP-binding protein
MAGVKYVGASRVYAKGVTPAVDMLDLDIKDGEFMVLVGPSGSGKTTALRMLAGLEPLDGGRIEIAGRDISDVQPKDRDIAMVFQNYALYPSKTVAENMGFALKMQHVPRDERDRRVREAARILDLDPALLDRKPKQLSGGQRQRVAMGRAIVREPKVFLMDEPLSNLDAKLRVQTRSQIAELQRRLGITTVYVTHDQVEAMTMGHRVAVLSGGKLQQCASPRELYDNPVNQFVAGFIGSPAMNLLTASLTASGASLAGADIPLSPAVRAAAARDKLTELIIGIRPEHLHVIGADAAAGGGAAVLTGVQLDGEVLLVEELGADALLHVRLTGDAGPVTGGPVVGSTVVARTEGRKSPAPGQRVAFRAQPDNIFSFHPATGARLAG